MNNPTLLFKTVGRKSQFEVITGILVIYQCHGAHKISESEFFLRLPLLTTVNP